MLRLWYRVVIVACLLFGTGLVGELRAEERTATLGSRVLTLTDLVIERHIDPPARQQMILSGVKALFRTAKRSTPPGLSHRVSGLSSHEEFREFLREILAEFADTEGAEQIVTAGLFSVVPGPTRLVDREANRVDGQIAANRYVGVGIVLSTDNKSQLPQIPKVLYNGPASHAGVESGDLILAVDGTATKSKPLAAVVALLRGKDGTEVTMTVRQPDAAESRKLTMRRGRVFIPTVEGFREKSQGEWQYTIDAASKIALLRLLRIGPSTLHELKTAAETLREQEIKGIILDLRFGGGLLHDTIMVADGLIDGSTIGYVRSHESRQKHEAAVGALFSEIPLALLVSENCSSGYVFLAAALQDQRQAVVIGQPTGGETYVNTIVDIPGRPDQLVLAVGELQRANGTPLLGAPRRSLFRSRLEGSHRTTSPGFVMPDHIVVGRPTRATESRQKPEEDRELSKAIEVLRAAA